MGVFVASATDGRVVFDRGEFTGAIGDSVTVIPLMVAIGGLSVFTNLGLAVLFGVFTHFVWTQYVHRRTDETA
jgi:hypothetical protein